MQILLAVYAVIVAALVVAELREVRKWQCIFKPLAALGFCVIALWGGVFGGTLEPVYGKIILAALIACAVGDVCLLSRDNPNLFKGGMAAFALGHGLYIWAIITAGTSLNVIALIGLIIIGAATYVSLHAKLPSDMRAPVLVYTAIIMGMVLTAIGSGVTILIAAAILFATSDIFVARDRFTVPNPKNALAISPLYFGAQALFAISPALLMTPAL
ncbi:MAG: lysoplasmalogenase [Maricaulaceae bacterium]